MSGQNTSTAFRIELAHRKAPDVVLGAGVEIAFNSEGGGAADWIMLLPINSSGLVPTKDGRGPYRVTDAAKLAASALSAHSGRIPIDENHATDLAAPAGRPAPARGWVTELDARPGSGIFGKVEWSAPGATLMAERAYRFISPVLICDAQNNVLDLPRASLTNTPNLRGMAALNAQENDSMDLLAQLRKLLGLADDADEGAVVAKVKGMCGTDTALQSIAKAAGLTADATSESILSTVTTLSTASKDNGAATIAQLQSELKDIGGQLQKALSTAATEKATAFIDGAIREGRVGVRPMRDHYISRHAESAEGAVAVEKEIGALPKLGNNGAILPIEPPAPKDGKVQLNADQLKTAQLLGIKPDDYAKTIAAEASSS